MGELWQVRRLEDKEIRDGFENIYRKKCEKGFDMGPRVKFVSCFNGPF